MDPDEKDNSILNQKRRKAKKRLVYVYFRETFELVLMRHQSKEVLQQSSANKATNVLSLDDSIYITEIRYYKHDTL